ncbi:MAG: mycothiol synthase [Bifidobacteriaceae bacterium]|jgi:mycothiol synthase|nr:mycothiol synthase [Bifidobacteriaceae bacterium]
MPKPIPLNLERRLGALEPAVRGQVTALAAQVRQYDGVEAVSEAPLLALAAGCQKQLHLLVWSGQRLAGYAQREGGGLAAELAVAPEFRRRGIAARLARALAEDTPGVRLWAHGDLGAARRVAAALGMAPVRELWEMTSERASRHALPPALPASAGADMASQTSAASYAFRRFEPARDRAAWVAVNAAAFANHPEQGRLTVRDLEQRMAQPWFDPAGLILAQSSGGGLAGYVWTKIEANAGEIYAIGVVPAAQGQRLGTRLLELGLRHLEAQGVAEVRLFVEADNAPAIAAYRRQGFQLARRDVQYAFPGLTA